MCLLLLLLGGYPACAKQVGYCSIPISFKPTKSLRNSIRNNVLSVNVQWPFGSVMLLSSFLCGRPTPIPQPPSLRDCLKSQQIQSAEQIPRASSAAGTP